MTAVEFLVNELNKEMGLISFVTGTEESYKSAIFSIIQQAKEMEKEQIIEAYGVKEDVYVNALKTGTQYYNETFNTKEK